MVNSGDLVVVESPLSGDHVNNFRYLLWCCRAVWDNECVTPIASHMICPWYMDDSDPEERQGGIDLPWVWVPEGEHYFFIDLGVSTGMKFAQERCWRDHLDCRQVYLKYYHKEFWQKFQAGEWPPSTEGFRIG